MTVAEVIAGELKERGVEFAFGIPGGEVVDLANALDAAGIRFILTKHETSAAFMADAYHRLTGRPGVCVATLGPGVSNAVTGAAQALLDRSAVLFLTGSVDSRLAPEYVHQVFDHGALLRPVTKWSGMATAANAARCIRTALAFAREGTPGPVHVDVPVDAAPREAPSVVPEARSRVTPAEVPPAVVDEIHDRLSAARQPLLVAGLGAAPPGAGALALAEDLRRFVDAWSVPVFTTFKAKGLLPEDHPLSLGPVGLSPALDSLALGAVERSDLVLLLGVDPVELRREWMGAWSRPGTVAVGASRGATPAFAAERELPGDVGSFIRVLGRRAPSDAEARRERAAARVAELRRLQDGCLRTSADPSGISPGWALRRLADRLGRDALVTVDTGAMRILANHVWRVSTPNSLLQSNGLGTMGYALPAAVAAALVAGGRPVVALAGDAGCLMVLGELALFRELGVPATVVVFVDDQLALIKLKGMRGERPPVGVDFGAPDFAAMAAAFGGEGRRITRPEELEEALAQPSRDGAAFRLLEVHVDPAGYGGRM
jgi:acetolactate synthase-1/2/3 large subunit